MYAVACGASIINSMERERGYCLPNDPHEHVCSAPNPPPPPLLQLTLCPYILYIHPFIPRIHLFMVPSLCDSFQCILLFFPSEDLYPDLTPANNDINSTRADELTRAHQSGRFWRFFR